ncbi:MAG: EamA family transporter [Proteobacteria bacterium]|nr:EamA family transporter [Pseudomonadota bacterium]MBU4297010.1 EamA family transporter [Pseudomonadota bacterium]MCG2749891.1 EamA family transporter [Desulfobulbaceae bacterium]
MDNWLLSALLAMIIYGFWGFFPKIAVSYISPQSALVFEVAGAILVGLVILFLIKFNLQFHPKGILFAVLTGIAGMTGTLFFFAAVQKGKISIVVGLTALYPLITVMLAVIFLREPLTFKQIIGLILACGAILLLST